LLLELFDPSGTLCSRNFYWLSSERDVVDQAAANWYMAPLKGFANFHALAELPPASVSLERTSAPTEPLTISLRNTGQTLAFFVRVRALDADGNELLPLYASDNYVSLLPGEALELGLAVAGSASRPTRIEASGFGVEPTFLVL
jgi:exo-1,4-beta-D-glucosaminidase